MNDIDQAIKGLCALERQAINPRRNVTIQDDDFHEKFPIDDEIMDWTNEKIEGKK